MSRRKRFGMMLAGIILMGVFQSLLIQVSFGVDTCTFMNLGLSDRTGISFGTCFFLVNALLLVPVLIFERRLIGVGTVLNMGLIGYISDFCRMLENRYLPAALFTELPGRAAVFLLTIPPFLLAIALYMNADLGQAPYDAVPTLLSRKCRLPFAAVRMAWDAGAVLIGIAMGRRLTIGTVVMALTVGPAVSAVGRLLLPKGEHPGKHR